MSGSVHKYMEKVLIRNISAVIHQHLIAQNKPTIVACPAVVSVAV